MQQHKDDRLRAQRRRLISNRVSALTTTISAARTAPPKRTIEDEYKPRFEEIALMPEVRELLLAPSDVVVDSFTLSETVVPMLPALEERWNRENRASLLALLDDSETPDGVDVLQLARSLFRCKQCERRMYYPDVLAHQCDADFFSKFRRKAQNEEEYYITTVECATFASHAWDVRTFERAPNPQMVDKVIALCGKAPESVTRKEMERADLWVVRTDPGLDPASECSRLGMIWLCAVSGGAPSARVEVY